MKKMENNLDQFVYFFFSFFVLHPLYVYMKLFDGDNFDFKAIKTFIDVKLRTLSNFSY